MSYVEIYYTEEHTESEQGPTPSFFLKSFNLFLGSLVLSREQRPAKYTYTAQNNNAFLNIYLQGL